MKTITKIFDIFTLIILAASILLFSVLLYVLTIWPNIAYEQILITMRDISFDVIFDNARYYDYIGAFLFFVIIYPLLYIFLNTKKRFYISLLFVFAILYFSECLQYYYYQNTTSTLYEDEYVYPKDIKYEFPAKKRNLILIYLESFEQNFSEPEHYQVNLIPHLSALQQSEGEYSLRANSYYGTDYSLASLFSSHCGIPLRYLANRDIYATKYFVPGAVCFSDILHQNGYQTSLVKAADITFTDAHIFAQDHGYDKALGVDEILSSYPESQHAALRGTFGGVSDEALFSFAKQYLASFSKDRPFLLTLFSLDTHAPTSYYSPNCKKTFNDVRDVFMCTDNTVNEFISWLKDSPYWENTTVVIMGDHLIPIPLKSTGYLERRIYNVFLNLPENLKINRQKAFATFDMAPSILDSLGIKQSLPALGLGRSLFSDEKTLTEKIGYDQFNVRLQQKSEIYNAFNIPKNSRKDVFTQYNLGTMITNKMISDFTDAYENVLGINYVDRLNLLLDTNLQHDIYADMRFNIISNYGSKLIITANGHHVFTFVPSKGLQQPYHISFTIPKKYTKDGKLQLQFRNTTGVVTATQMGIALFDITLSESK